MALRAVKLRSKWDGFLVLVLLKTSVKGNGSSTYATSETTSDAACTPSEVSADPVSVCVLVYAHNLRTLNMMFSDSESSLSIYVSKCVHTHGHEHAHARARTHTHAHMHTYKHTLSLSLTHTHTLSL